MGRRLLHASVCALRDPNDNNTVGVDAGQEIAMSNDQNTEPSFFSRVMSSETTKKGIAGVIAGLLVAVVTETLWPSTQDS